MTEELQELLQTGRGRLGPVSAGLEAQYRSIYQGLIELLESAGFAEPPALHVVYSPFALTEFLGTSSQTWIVYDQFLGQIFARLTALVDQNADLNAIDTYLTKVYADRLLVNGRSRESLLVVLAHSVMRLGDEFRATSSTDRWKSVTAQETFTLAHELTHFALAASPQFRSKWWELYSELTFTAEEILRTRPGRPTIEQAAQALADDHNREYVRRHGDLDPAVLAEGRAKLAAQYASRIESSLIDIADVMADAGLAEEVVCDGIAVILTGQLLGRGDAKAVRATLVSALKAIQHLRLIKFMDAQLLDSQRAEQVLRASTARGHSLRLFLRAIFESGMAGLWFGIPSLEEVDPDEFHQFLVDLHDANQTFYERVFDTLITGSFYERFKPIYKTDGTGEWNVSGLPDPEESWSQAADLLGF